VGPGETLGGLFWTLSSLSIIRRKSVAEREPSSGTGSDINMSATNPPPHKRKLSQPDVNASGEAKKQKLAESNTNTIPSKTAAKEKDAEQDKEVSKDDLKPPKKTMTKKVKPTTSVKPGTAGVTSTAKPSNGSEEFPNGHLYCHQCNKKRDASRESSPLPIHFQPWLPPCSLRSHRGYQLYRGREEVQDEVLQAVSKQSLR
jgi:hypothetical protein